MTKFWKMLTQGNRRYLKSKKFAGQRESAIVKPQPFAIVVSCADSRVPPEIIFDQGIGKIFTIRTAGQVVDQLVIDSIEYAITLFDAKILIVMGHTDCIAVKGALLALKTKIKNVDFKNVLVPIEIAIEEANIDYAHENVVEDAIKANIIFNANQILSKSRSIADAMGDKQIELKKILYDVRLGQIEILND